MQEEVTGGRQKLGKWLKRDDVQFTIIVLIVINSIMMGIGTFDFVKDNPTVSKAFNIIDLVFLITFTVELFAHFIHRGLRLFCNKWLIFDFIVIIISWIVTESQVFRAFRIFRTLRLIPKVKVMKNLIDALVKALPRVCMVGLLLLINIFIFAIMFTDMYKDASKELSESKEWDYDYFSRLDFTILTLLQFITFDNWAVVARDVMEYESWAWVMIIIFIVISGFIAVNLFVGVIVDSISDISSKDKRKLYGQQVESSSDDDEQSLDGKDEISKELDRTIRNLERKIRKLRSVQKVTSKALDGIKKESLNEE